MNLDHPCTITRTVRCPLCGRAMLDSDNSCVCEDREIEEETEDDE